MLGSHAEEAIFPDEQMIYAGFKIPLALLYNLYPWPFARSRRRIASSSSPSISCETLNTSLTGSRNIVPFTKMASEKKDKMEGKQSRTHKLYHHN